MKNKAVKFGIVATVLPHIFCCGLPILLSIVGLVAPDAAHFHIIPHSAEPWIFVISGCLLILSWIMVLRECSCDCKNCHGVHSHRPQKIILTIVTVAFLLSILLHIVAH